MVFERKGFKSIKKVSISLCLSISVCVHGCVNVVCGHAIGTAEFGESLIAKVVCVYLRACSAGWGVLVVGAGYGEVITAALTPQTLDIKGWFATYRETQKILAFVR